MIVGLLILIAIQSVFIAWSGVQFGKLRDEYARLEIKYNKACVEALYYHERGFK